MKFRDLKVGTKQILGFGSILIIMAGVNIFSIAVMDYLISEINDFEENLLPRALAISEINYNSSNLRREQLQVAFAKDEKLRQEAINLLITYIDKINESVDLYEDLRSEFGSQEEYTTEEDSLYSVFDHKWEEYQDLSFEFFKLSAEYKNQQALELLNGQARDVFNEYSKSLTELVDIYERNVIEAAEQAGRAYEGTRFITAVLLIIAIILSIFLTIIIVRLIIIPVYRLEKAAKKVADDNLDVQVKITSNDEIGQFSKSFNQMTTSLKEAKEKESVQKEKLKMQWEVLSETNQELEIKSKHLEKQKSQTEKKNAQLEEAMAKLKATQNQLVQSEKMASLGQLTAGIAHEINNPINFISSNINPLKRDLEDILALLSRYNETVKKCGSKEDLNKIDNYKEEIEYSFLLKEIKQLLNGIDEGAKRTTEIVRGLRNFSRLDEEEKKLANINEGIESTLLMLRNQLKNRIEVIRDFGDIPPILCYPGQLNQVFMNVLSNAGQSIEGKGKIIIQTKSENLNIIISIKDTGKGMTDEVREHIFEPFYTTKDVGRGTGLGLSISYGIVQDHSGQIEVKSKPGQGTEFIITLPLEN
jgi:signal transduction histidine kinase